MKRQKDIKKGEGNMRYKFELSIMIAVVFGLSLAGVASADSVTKTLYVDGAVVGTSTTNQAISFPYQRLTIGCEGNAWVRYSGLVGQIDEFAVYSRVLTDAEVTAHAGAGAAGYVAAVTASNPVLYLRFEDACSSDGSKALNSVNADTNSTYRGAITLTAAGGGYTTGGKAAILVGSGNSDCIDVCDWDAKFSTTNVSVEFWVKTTQNSGYPRFFQHNGSDTEQRSYGAMYSAGTGAIGLIGGGSTGYANSTINDGAWHHIVVTFNSIKTLPYENEVMNDDPCVYLKFDHPLAADSSVNHYFAGYTTNALVKPVGGAIGGHALYLNNSPGSGKNGCAYVWNDGGNVGNQIQGSTVYRTGPGSSNLYSQWYALTYDSSLTPVVGSMSFEFWFKSTPELKPDRFGMFFQQIDGMSWDSDNPTVYGKEPNAPGMGLDTNTVTGVAQLRVLGGSQWWYPGVNAPLDGNWHHVVVTYDPNENNLGHDMGIELYLDGTRYSTTIVDANNYQAQLSPYPFYVLMIGTEQNFFYRSNSFGGYIDEFAVYKGVLPPERAAAHYAAGQAGTEGQPTNCAEVWASGQGLNGDLNRDCIVNFYDFAIFAENWRAQ
jgi:hypothetical protein